MNKIKINNKNKVNNNNKNKIKNIKENMVKNIKDNKVKNIKDSKIDKKRYEVLSKLRDPEKIQYYQLWDIIENFGGDDYIANNFLEMVEKMDDIELLKNLDKYIEKIIQKEREKYKLI